MMNYQTIHRWVCRSVFIGVPLTATILMAKPQALLCQLGFPSENSAIIEALTGQLETAGYQVTPIDAHDLCDPSRLPGEQSGLLVLPNGSNLPVAAAPAIEQFAKSGGNIIALGTPLWQKPMVHIDGRWTPLDRIMKDQAGQLPPHVLFNFTPDDIRGWIRSKGPNDGDATIETTNAGPAVGTRALHITISRMINWDTHGPTAIERPFPSGHTMTVFSARGGPDTPQLSFEWREKDGSRWIAVIALTSEWRRYVLTPEDFHYWDSVPARSRDRFRSENAETFYIGLSASHTRSVTTGPHEYWIGPIGTAPDQPEYRRLSPAGSIPFFDTFCPIYKLFPCREVAYLKTRGDQAIVKNADFPVPAALRSPHPRPRGCGFDTGRAWRWIPILEARTLDGQWRGAPVTILAHAGGSFKGALWASFGIDDPSWYREPASLELIGQMARWMRRETFILDAGPDHYTYTAGQAVTLGVQIASTGDEKHHPMEAKISIRDGSNGREVYTNQWPVHFGDSDRFKGEVEWSPSAWPDQGFTCVSELWADNDLIDKVQSDFHAMPARPEKHFITVRDGHFQLDGKRWRAHGINYMPSSGIGTEDGPYFENWLGKRSYDPEVIQRDLDHIKSLGFNAVSIFVYHHAIKDQNLLDLLRRLDRLGIRANLSLRPGSPRHDYPWHLIREIIEFNRLADNDTLFAYDLDWEPTFGTREERATWDQPWHAWITERYGSLEAAEKDWGVAVPRNQEKVTNPAPHQVDTDGPWRIMTAAYRRFLDTLLYKKYNAVRQLIRQVDPHHLVSFRMSDAACPEYRWGGRITYDFPYLAGAVDILAPEAYGRIGDWEKVKPGVFEVAYARWAGPHLPVIWAEAGVNAWDLSVMTDSGRLLDFQAQLYRDLYRMLILSDADGIFFWWYPGGFRCHEESDYGIIQPDGSDRPVTQVIREHAGQFLNAPSSPAPDVWLQIDRDRHPDGVSGIYDAVKESFWKARQEGRTPGLKTIGTGTTSANCPLVAVGNIPCNGQNPPKYLDAVFDVFEINDASGHWTSVETGKTVRIHASRPVIGRAGIRNLGEATWLKDTPPDQPAGKVVVAIQGSNLSEAPLLDDVPRFGIAQMDSIILAPAGLKQATEVTIQLQSKGRVLFGEKMRVILTP